MSQENENISITGLGENDLLEIFQYLDGRTLKTCALVCKEWNRTIGTSVKTMRRLPLIFKKGWEKKETEITDLCRKHHTIIIGSIDINEKLAKAVMKFAVTIRKLQIDNVNIIDGGLSKILSSTQKLDHLDIFYSTIDKHAFEEDRTPCTVTAIKTLRFTWSDWEFFDFIKNTQVRELICNPFARLAHDYTATVKDFLEKQTTLKSLTVRVHGVEIFRIMQKNRLMQLNKLTVDFEFWEGDPDEADDAFVKFLVTQQNSLQILEISRKISEKVLECIVTKLKISTLIIDSTDSDDLPSDPAFYRMNPNKYLSTLVFRVHRCNLESGKGLLQVYPSITKLVIEQWWNEVMINEMLIFMSNNCKNLQTLEIPRLTTNTPQVSIPSLKTFRIHNAGAANGLQTFCVNNPSIENLIVECTIRDTLSYEVMNTITTRLVNLRCLLFGFFFTPATRILEMIARNCSKLQLLEVFDRVSEENESRAFAGDSNFRVQYYHLKAYEQLFPKIKPFWMEVDDEKIEYKDDYYEYDDEGMEVDNNFD